MNIERKKLSLFGAGVAIAAVLFTLSVGGHGERCADHQRARQAMDKASNEEED